MEVVSVWKCLLNNIYLYNYKTLINNLITKQNNCIMHKAKVI